MIHDDDHDEQPRNPVPADAASQDSSSSPSSESDAAPWKTDPYRADPWMRDPWIERGLTEEEQAALDAEQRAADAAAEASWEPTPELPREERDRKVAADVNRLVWVSLIVAVALLAVVGVGALVGLEFCATLLPGLAIGSAVAVVNLRLMAGGAVAMFHRNPVGALVGFGLSFALLLGTAVYVLKSNSSWMLGYGLGIALPALSGVVYGFLSTDRSTPSA